MSSPGRPGEVPAVTDDTFERDVLMHTGPVLVDFWAQWCPPCHMIAPVLAEIAAERAESLTVRKVNADENPRAAQDYRVMSLPTLVLFRDGQPVQAWVGARSKTRLLSELDKALRPLAAQSQPWLSLLRPARAGVQPVLPDG